LKNINRQWRVARYPESDELIGSQHFEWHESDMPEPEADEFLVRTHCLAPIPAQRGYLSPSHDAFFSNIPKGEVMRGRGVGQIIASRHPDYREGEFFVGSLGWQDYSIQKPRGEDFVFSTRKITHPLSPLSHHLSFLGQSGVTAYFGLTEAGQMKPGDNILIASAAGGVGSCAGQIARIKGARKVVGITSTDEKCRWLCNELGFDAAINYKTDNINQKLAEFFPEGIDVYYDNVGGAILDTALLHLALGARVIIAGFISTDYEIKPSPGLVHYKNLLRKRARMQGFVFFDYWDRYDEAEQFLKKWHAQGELHDCEDLDEGLENMPESLASLFTGSNRGCKVCRIAPDPD